MRKIVFLMALLSSLAFANTEFRSVLEKLCNEGRPESCFYLGALYSYGQSAVRQDRNKAVESFRKACYLGDASGCTVLENLLNNR